MPSLTGDHYVLKRHLLRLFDQRCGIYDERGNLVLQSDAPFWRMRKEFLLRGLGVDPLAIYSNSFANFAARYDVVDVNARTKIGALQRKWLHAMVRDEWTLLDPWDQPIGQVIEDSVPLALVRRFATSLIPQNYDLLVGGRKVADLRQNFNPFTYHLSIDFLVPPAAFDRRLGIAAAVLLNGVEGRQRSERDLVTDLVDLPF